jgi:hypothetical protein
MENSYVPEDRLHRKLTFACSDGRSVEECLNLWLLTDPPALSYVVVSITLNLLFTQF